jgi:hypothetical protein
MTDVLELARKCGARVESYCAGTSHMTTMNFAALTAFAARIREEAMEEAAQIAANMPACPFDGPTKLEPDQPCPVCGDRGDDLDAPSNCRSAAAAIRKLKEPR